MTRKVVLSLLAVFLSPLFTSQSQALAQDQTIPITTIGPIRKTVVANGRDTVIVSLPPFEGLSNPSCGIAAGTGRVDTVQSFPSGRWSCTPVKAVSWQLKLRLSARVIAGTASDSLKASFFYVDADGRLSGGNARVYALGSASTVANPGALAISSTTATALDPARALALDIENPNTGGATRYEFYIDLW